MAIQEACSLCDLCAAGRGCVPAGAERLTLQTPIGANDIWPLRDQSDENLGRVFSVWEIWG